MKIITTPERVIEAWRDGEEEFIVYGGRDDGRISFVKLFAGRQVFKAILHPKHIRRLSKYGNGGRV